MSRAIYFHGVISDDRISVGSHDGPFSVRIPDLSMKVTAILRLADFYGLATVWVAPGCTLSHVDPDVFCNADESMWDIRYTEIATTAQRLNRMKNVTAWRKEGTFEEKRTIEIIFPEQTSWQWEETDPLTLLQAIQRLQSDTAVKIDSHPGSVGRELMKWWIQKGLQLTPKIDLEQLPAKCGRDFAWKIPISSKATWLHAYDKNSMYLSAASGANLGIGDPTYYAGANMKTPDLRLAGVWHIEAERSDKQPVSIPFPLRKFAKNLPWPLANGQEWCTTPILKCLIEMGCHVQVFEGYEWQTSRRVLAKWSDAVWGLRMSYKYDKSEVGQLCYHSMKRIATATVGLLASDKTRDRQWYRPDWWSTIIETAKARMIYNIDHYIKEYGIVPCMVHTDALYYVSDSPDPDKRLLQRQNELGGYKHKLSIPIDRDVIDWFEAEKSAGEVVTLINEREETINGDM